MGKMRDLHIFNKTFKYQYCPLINYNSSIKQKVGSYLQRDKWLSKYSKEDVKERKIKNRFKINKIFL